MGTHSPIYDTAHPVGMSVAAYLSIGTALRKDSWAEICVYAEGEEFLF